MAKVAKRLQKMCKAPKVAKRCKSMTKVATSSQKVKKVIGGLDNMMS